MHDGYWETIGAWDEDPPFMGRVALAVGLLSMAAGVLIVVVPCIVVSSWLRRRASR